MSEITEFGSSNILSNSTNCNLIPLCQVLFRFLRRKLSKREATENKVWRVVEFDSAAANNTINEDIPAESVCVFKIIFCGVS